MYTLPLLDYIMFIRIYILVFRPTITVPFKVSFVQPVTLFTDIKQLEPLWTHKTKFAVRIP